MEAITPRESATWDEALASLPPPVRNLFRKLVEVITSTLQSTLIDTLVGEFNEKFDAMWNTPGDRDTARALRRCDRTHRETAIKVTREVLLSQLTLVAKTITGNILKGGESNNEDFENLLSVLESKVTRLEQAIPTIEE